jgi:cardiolipin synthase
VKTRSKRGSADGGGVSPIVVPENKIVLQVKGDDPKTVVLLPPPGEVFPGWLRLRGPKPEQLKAAVGKAIDLRLGQIVPPAIGSSEFEQMLDTVTGTAARAGNDVQLLFDGKAAFAERLRLIESATSSIDMQTFIFAADETGWQIARALAKRAREGIPVRLIVDAIGSHSGVMDPAMTQMMKDAGVEIRVNGSWLSPNGVWHEKHLIIDGCVAINGGMNVGDKYAFGGTDRKIEKHGKLRSGWRDVDMRLEGASVLDVHRAFLRNWERLGGVIREGEWMGTRHRPENGSDLRVRVIQHDPQADTNTTLAYLAAIRGAQRSITIENAYFVPIRAVREALIDAARRGVEVRIMTNGDTSSDMTVATGCARHIYQDLLAAGVRIFERQGDSTLHAKTATFDGCYSIIGSHNLNGRSHHFDTEIVLCVEDPRSARQLEERFDSGLGQAVEITGTSAALRGWLRRLRRWTLSGFADLS